jgi:hypothetical protein
MTVRRTVYITGILVLCTWTLVPIYLIALSAVGGRAVVNNWPKPFLPPTDISLETIREFLDITGVWTSALYSVEAAVLCMAFSILLGVPAGYALARFTFAGATTYRLLILLTRAFPVAILALPLTVGFIRLGLYDTPFGVSLMHTTLALPFASLGKSLPSDPARARGGRLGVRLLAGARVLEGRIAACAARHRSGRDLCLRHFLERSVRRLCINRAAQDADGVLAFGPVRKPAARAVRRRLLADRPLGAIHLPRPQTALFDVGHRHPMSPP